MTIQYTSKLTSIVKTPDDLLDKIKEVMDFIISLTEGNEEDGDNQAADDAYNVIISFCKFLRELTHTEYISQTRDILIDDINKIFK